MNRYPVKIVPLKLQHSEEMQVLASDKLISDTTSLPHPYPLNGAVNFINETIIKRNRKEEFLFAVINAQDLFVGTSCLLKCNFEDHSAILGYWIGVPFWGKGYATA